MPTRRQVIPPAHLTRTGASEGTPFPGSTEARATLFPPFRHDFFRWTPREKRPCFGEHLILIIHQGCASARIQVAAGHMGWDVFGGCIRTRRVGAGTSCWHSALIAGVPRPAPGPATGGLRPACEDVRKRPTRCVSLSLLRVHPPRPGLPGPLVCETRLRGARDGHGSVSRSSTGMTTARPRPIARRIRDRPH